MRLALVTKQIMLDFRILDVSVIRPQGMNNILEKYQISGQGHYAIRMFLKELQPEYCN